MRKPTICAGFLAAMLIAASCAHRHTEPITKKLVDVENPRIANGQMLYNRYCQTCHPAGEAGLGPEVTHKPGFARRLQVRHGFGRMPAFKKDVISRRELGDIMKYLNHLAKL
jgi:mono/diheme cytochrome c family protein